MSDFQDINATGIAQQSNYRHWKEFIFDANTEKLSSHEKTSIGLFSVSSNKCKHFRVIDASRTGSFSNDLLVSITADNHARSPLTLMELGPVIREQIPECLPAYF